MDIHFKSKRLASGESFLSKEKGNSMVKKGLHSNQLHLLEPISLEDCQIDDIVYCRVRGKYMTHLVKALDPLKGAQICNAEGFVNGWSKNVYGRVVAIYTANRLLPIGRAPSKINISDFEPKKEKT